MKVFIAGATGVLGRRLVQQFAARRDDVIGLGWVPKYPTIDDGLRAVIETWRGQRGLDISAAA